MKILGYILLLVSIIILVLSGSNLSTTVVLISLLLMFAAYALISPKKAAKTGGFIAVIVGLLVLLMGKNKNKPNNESDIIADGKKSIPKPESEPTVAFQSSDMVATGARRIDDGTWEVGYMDRSRNNVLTGTFRVMYKESSGRVLDYPYKVFWSEV